LAGGRAREALHCAFVARGLERGFRARTNDRPSRMSFRFAVTLLLLGFAAAAFFGHRLLVDPDRGESEVDFARRIARQFRVDTASRPSESRPTSGPADGPPESTAPAPGTVVGRVVDRGGIKIPHAKVNARLRTPPGERTYALVSEFSETKEVDSEGLFRFDLPGGGFYRFVAEAEGFAPGIVEGVKPGTEIEIVVDVGAALTIVATDKTTGKPVEGAAVALQMPKSGVDKKAKTDAAGLARFTDLPPGPATLSARHDEYVARTRVEHVVDLGSAADVALELDPGKSIKGKVTSADEQRPIGGAFVSVGKKKVRTDEGGRYVLRGLGSESHELKTVADGYLPNERTLSLAGSRQEAEADIQLERGAVVRGRVVDEESNAVVGAELKLFQSWGGDQDGYMWLDWSARHFNATTAEDGSFKLAGIQPQPWSQRTLRVRHPKFADAFERGIKVEKKDDEFFFVVTMRKGGSISGRVADDQNRPIAGARVELRPQNVSDWDWEGEETVDGETVWVDRNLVVSGTDLDGRFEFGGLSEGRYDVQVHARGWSSGTKDGLELTKGGRLESVFFTLERGETLRGYVVDPAEKPVAGAQIHVGTNNGYAQAVSAADGTFEIPTIPKGPYNVTATATGFATLRLTKQMPDGDRGLRVSMKKQGVYRGVVIDAATKKPIRGAEVNLQKEEPRWGNSMRTWSWNTTDKDGTFKAQADDGEYQLVVTAERYVKVTKDDVRISSDLSQEEPETIEMRRGGAVEGFVFGEDGRPDTSTTVYYRKDEPEALAQYAGQSEADGYYYCGDLDPGTYELIFQRDAVPLTIERGVFVAGEKPAKVDVRLASETELEIVVVWKDAPKPPKPPNEENPTAANATPSPEAIATPARPNGPPKKVRRPRPSVTVVSTDGRPLSLDWRNDKKGEGHALGFQTWIWMGRGQERATTTALPAGKFRVQVAAKDHVPASENITLTQGMKAVLTIELVATPNYKPSDGPVRRSGSWVDEEGNVHRYDYWDDD
jgi:protocatechuate 3,4-dioxygenase beta subunit